MGYRSDGFGFAAQWYADADATAPWSTALDPWVLLEPLAASGHLAHADRISIDQAPAVALGSPDALREQARGWRRGAVALTSGDPDDPAWLFHLTFDSTAPAIFIGIPRREVTDALRAQLASWLAAWVAVLDGARIRFALGAFRPDDVAFPRPVPPRSSPIWQPGAIDQYLGRTWHLADPARAAVLAAIEQAPLPEGAQRSRVGDVVRVAFAAELEVRASVIAARVAHEQWITPLVPVELEPGWNALGDRAVFPAQPVRRAPFALYDARDRVGYVALVVMPDGTIDVDAWNQAAAIAQSGALADGTPVDGVRLVVPRRADAIALHPRARAAGFQMTTYGTGQVFWEVYPEPEPVA